MTSIRTLRRRDLAWRRYLARYGAPTGWHSPRLGVRGLPGYWRNRAELVFHPLGGDVVVAREARQRARRTVELAEWCGTAQAHAPHESCNGFGRHAGPGLLPDAPRPLPKHTGPQRSSRTGAIRKQHFPAPNGPELSITGSNGSAVDHA